MADRLPVLDEMDHNGNSDLLTSAQFPTSRLSFFFVYVPTVLLEERQIVRESVSGGVCRILLGSREVAGQLPQHLPHPAAVAAAAPFEGAAAQA